MPRSCLIAVVDDDDSFRVALAESLRSLGYDARGFSSADEFIAGDEIGPYDCVITDIRMPGISGLELSRLLAARAPPIPVVMITAVTDPSLETKAAASGAVCVLKKPFGSDALIDCLRKALPG